MVTLDTDVIKYEPHLALYGGEDGLDFYRSIAGNWKDALLYSGMLLLECGYRQATQVAAILEENAYHNIQILEDLSGVPRIVTGMSL